MRADGQPQQLPLQQQSLPQAPPQQQSSQQQSVDALAMVSSGSGSRAANGT
jgi:hypothetical protein